MTKLEELTALLINEINDFNNGIKKLEKINDHLNDNKIKIDLTEYKSMIESHQQQMAYHLNSIERFEDSFDSKLKQAKKFTTWAVVVFIVVLTIGISSFAYIIIL